VLSRAEELDLANPAAEDAVQHRHCQPLIDEKEGREYVTHV
jgi:hypothetical protein